MNCTHIDICLLYADGYREPSKPRPCKSQTNPPSIPISQLYADNSFPTGLAMPYTVSNDYCLDTYMYIHVIYGHSFLTTPRMIRWLLKDSLVKRREHWRESRRTCTLISEELQRLTGTVHCVHTDSRLLSCEGGSITPWLFLAC